MTNRVDKTCRRWTAGMVVALMLVGGSVLSLRSEAAEPVSDLQGVVSEWIDLRSALSRENREWEGEEARLKATLTVLERRRDVLTEEVAASREVRSTESAQEAQLARRRGELEAVLSEFEPFVEQAERAAQTWLARIPPPLHDVLEPHGAGEPDRRESLAGRLQKVLSLCASLEELRSSNHVRRQVIETNGETHEYEVLYLGTAQAYGTTPDRAKAAWGHPRPDGWRWTRIDADVAQVAAAIDMLAGDVPASYVTLPVTLSGIRGGVAGEVSP